MIVDNLPSQTYSLNSLDIFVHLFYRLSLYIGTLLHVIVSVYACLLRVGLYR
jgi:hypothetical protein